jgi:hypothetical protein
MGSILKGFPLLRQAMPTYTRHFPPCRLKHPSSFISPKSLPSCQSRSLFQSFPRRVQRSPILRNVEASPTSQSTENARKKSFPETSDKSVAYWLLGSAASVFGIVIFGGLTRLTESGYVVFRVASRMRQLTIFQTQHNRMEACNGLLATAFRRGLGKRVRKVPSLARVQAT